MNWSGLRGNMRKVLTGAVLAGAMYAGLAFPARASDSGLQTLVYEVYAGGIHAVQATLDIDMRKSGRYDVVLGAQTRGLLGKLAPWEGTFETYGWVNENGSYQPELHKSTAVWRGEKETKEYNYSRNGGFQDLVVTDKDQPPYKKDIEQGLTEGTTDALTATLAVMENVGSGKKCEGSSEVFDGKRRFEMIYRPEKSVVLEPSRYNIYGGPAEMCTVEVKPIAGGWSKKPRGWLSIQEQGRERGTMPTVWMGKVSREGPAVPVKIMVKTQYGALFMHLVEYKSGDEFYVAENRAGE